MNKFFAATILALVAVSACVSAATDDSREVGLLLGSESVFEDFCLAERDSISASIKAKTNQQTAWIYEIFFGAATEIADEVLTVEQKAVEEFAKELKSPAAEVADAPLPEDEVQNMIEQGKRDIQAQSGVLGRLAAAGKNMVGNVLYNVANSAIFVRLAKARSYMNRDNLVFGVVQTCGVVTDFEHQIEADFEAAKESLLAKHAGDAELTKTIQEMTVQKLKCYTTKYISRLSAFCQVFKNGATAFMKMLGLGSNYQLPSQVTSTIAQ